MKTDGRNIVPVLLGADLNAYSVALAFREAYGVVSHVFARYKCGATENSKFIITHIYAGIDDTSVAIPALLKFAAENNGAELFLIPCADWYVEMVENAKAQLCGIYNIYVPDTDIWRTLSDKSSFYELIKKADISHPPYVAFEKGDNISRKKLDLFGYPAVIKPSDSTEYWRHPFCNMQKVYFPESFPEAENTIRTIFASGYSKKVIFQKKVGGSDCNRVLTTVSDSRGRVVRAVLGEVILEECGKTSQGNHAAIITRPLDDVCFQLIDLLSKIRYKGIANVDIIASEGVPYVLELNPRQGRSCDYLRACGVNLAELIVKFSNGEHVTPDFSYREIYWHHPSHNTVMKYSSLKNRAEAERLRREGKEYTPYLNDYEGVKRRIYASIHNFRLGKKFKKTQKRIDG